jgi:UDPglucose 6-dehydrogenase
MRVAIAGGGRVGLPTALSFARMGHLTVVYDTDSERISSLIDGTVPFYEPGLEELLSEQVAIGHLSFTTDPREALADVDAVFICVDTPTKVDGQADLRAVESAARTVARCVVGTAVVVTKSTVPLGTGLWLQELFAQEGGAERLLVASNPEFLQEGLALNEALSPARILVGSDSSQAKAVLRDAYAPFVEAGAVWIETDLATAELTKYASNAFLAMKISYANVLAEISDLTGADVVTLTRALGVDPRIGAGHLRPGIGFGGGCLSKDLAALRTTLDRMGLKVGLLDEVEAINARALQAVVRKVRGHLGDVNGRRLTILGLAFKPDTDDVRFSPALRLAAELQQTGAVVIGYDPRATEAARERLPGLLVDDDLYRALEGAECAVVCTEWQEIRALDLGRASAAMAQPIIIDGRNIFEPAAMAAAGFTYVATGRPSYLAPTTDSQLDPV